VESYEMLKGKRREMQEQKKMMMIEEIKKGEKKTCKTTPGLMLQ
jgi:acyl-CoA-binding protein